MKFSRIAVLFVLMAASLSGFASEGEKSGADIALQNVIERVSR
jgi:hypothetical protein